MPTKMQKAEGALYAKQTRAAKRKTKVAELRHEPRKMKVSTSTHKPSNTTIKHGNVKRDMKPGRTKKAI